MTAAAEHATAQEPKASRTYGRMWLDGDTWVLKDLEPHVAIRLKRVFPSIPAGTSLLFRLRHQPDVCRDLDWFIERYPLDVPDGHRAALRRGRKRYEAAHEAAERILQPGWSADHPIGFRDGMAPYPYQQQAAALARTFKRLLLLDDVGLGKTVSALATIADPAYLPCAIVVQPHVADQWKDEFIEAFTTLSCHIVKKGSPYTLPKADLYIFSYSKIAGWADVAARGRFRAVIFDEVQDCRHGDETAKGRGARAFANGADLRLGLTATPIYNYGPEIYNVLSYIAPGALGSWHEFVVQWCTSQNNKWVVADPAALRAYLDEQHITLRRTEDDVGWQMPRVNTIVQTVPYDEAEAAKTEEEARTLAIKVMSGSFVERGSAARELSMLARMTTGVAKARGVAAYVRVLLESGRAVLLTGWHRDVYDIWLKDLAAFDPILFTGTESPAAKRAAKEAFIGGKSDLMIMSLRSGVGLDGLQQRCHTLVFGELDWSPQVHKQIVGRLRRPGQTAQVDAIYPVADGGSDPLIMSVLGVKASQSRGPLDPLAGAERVESDETRVRRLAQLYLGETEMADAD